MRSFDGSAVLKRFLLIFSDLIFVSRVDPGIPSLAAAPDGPDTRPPLPRRAASIISFSWTTSFRDRSGWLLGSSAGGWRACLAIALPANFIYEEHLVRSLKKRMRRKAALFPGKFDLGPLARVRTVREFDDVITARYCGFRDATDYYVQPSALRVAAEIRVPTLIVTAQDGPFVPFASFSDIAITNNANIRLTAPEHGCHCAFISRYAGAARYWAEARVMEFFGRLEALSASPTASGGASSKPLD
jgi:hypothetical protein